MVDLQKTFYWIVKNKKILTECLNYFQEKDAEDGILTVYEDMMNQTIRPLLIERLEHTLKDYKVIFSNGYIYLNVELSWKKLQRINALYRLSIQNLIFTPEDKKVVIEYQEDIKLEKGLIPQMLFEKGMRMKGGTALQFLVETQKRPGITADERFISVDLHQTGYFQKSKLKELTLEFLDCEDGRLRFQMLSRDNIF